jgi:hypothetical protein
MTKIGEVVIIFCGVTNPLEIVVVIPDTPFWGLGKREDVVMKI